VRERELDIEMSQSVSSSSGIKPISRSSSNPGNREDLMVGVGIRVTIVVRVSGKG
jgi:hypothetical protein